MKKRALFIFISLASIIAALMVYSFFISPSYENIQTLRAEVHSKQEAVSRYNLSAQRMNSLVQQYENVGDVKETLTRILPLKKDPRFIVAQIAGLARLSNASVEAIRMDVASEKQAESSALKNLGVFKSDIRVGGSYNGIKQFMNRIDNNIIPFTPEVITLRIEQTTGAPYLVMEGIFENYYQVTQ